MKVILCRSRAISSRLIQSVTWSRWSHCAVQDGDYVIEAVGVPPFSLILVLFGIRKNSIKLGGVVATPLSEFNEKHRQQRIVYVDGDMDKLRSCVGMLYDAWGVLGIKLKRQIHCPDKMTCCKLVAYAAYGYRDEFIYTSTVQKILEISGDHE